MGSYKAWKPPQTERKSRSPSFSGSKPTICKANPKGNNKQVRRNEHVHRATKPVPFLKYTVSVKNNRKQTTSTRRKDKACQILCYAYIVPEFWYWALPAALGERDVVLDAGKYLVLTWCKKKQHRGKKTWKYYQTHSGSFDSSGVQLYGIFCPGTYLGEKFRYTPRSSVWYCLCTFSISLDLDGCEWVNKKEGWETERKFVNWKICMLCKWCNCTAGLGLQ